MAQLCSNKACLAFVLADPAGLTLLTHSSPGPSLAQVLTEPKNALLKQYSGIFKKNGVQLHVTESGVRALAREAGEKGVGARGLRSILERVLLDAMFHAADTDVEGVVVHSDEEGRIAPAVICRGGGSFRCQLRALGEPVAPGEEEARMYNSDCDGGEALQAATAS